jgi:hypothetical protein
VEQTVGPGGRKVSIYHFPYIIFHLWPVGRVERWSVASNDQRGVRLRILEPVRSTTMKNDIWKMIYGNFPAASSCLLSSGVNQLIQLLGPIRINILQNVVLLDGGVAIPHRQEALSQIEIRAA